MMTSKCAIPEAPQQNRLLLIRVFFMFICIKNYQKFIKNLQSAQICVCNTIGFLMLSYAKRSMKVDKISQFVQIQSKTMKVT